MKTKNISKTIYEVDPFNRLIYAKTGKASLVPRFRKVLDGRFTVDEKNTLIYRAKRPADSGGREEIRLTGEYSLDKNHDLILTLHKKSGQKSGDTLKIKGEIMDARADKIAFAVTTKDSSGNFTGYILELEGAWHADEYNRLSFNIKKEKGAANSLLFRGEWNINRRNQITYTYLKENLKRKTKLTQTIGFRGYWDVTEKMRLMYVLNKEINSVFDFKVSLGEPLARGLRYEIGIGAKPVKKEMELFGRWKITDKLGLELEVQYEKGKTRAILFGGTCALTKKDTFEFKLKSEKGKPLGLDLKLSRKILKDQGELFLRALSSGKEKQILLGGGWRW